MFPMGIDKFKPIPNNVIYNIYADCDKDGYNYVSSSPFITGDSGNKKQNNINVNCTITIISPHNSFKSTGTIHLVGFGSRLFKKLTWAFKFDERFLGRRAIKLRAMANDPTLVREKLATELYKAVGVPVQEGTYARLFINGDTYGLYHMIDGFSKRWLKGYVHGDINAKIGISYKLYAHIPEYPNFKYEGDDYKAYDHFYMPDEYEDEEIDSKDNPALFERVKEFTRLFDEWVNTPGQPVDQLAKFFNIELTLRMMVIDTLVIALDNFSLRLSNVALYYMPERDKYLLLPYDFDKVLKGHSEDPVLDKVTYITDCFTWTMQHEEIIEHYFTKTLLNHPEIRARYETILAKTSNEVFTTDKITEYVNAVANLIRPDIEWSDENAFNLDIAYDGVENHYSIDHFEANIGYEPVDYKNGVVNNDAPFGILKLVELRGDNCRAATVDVDTSNNDNISDNDVKVKVYQYDGNEYKNNDILSADAKSGDPAKITLSTLNFTIFLLFFTLSLLMQ